MPEIGPTLREARMRARIDITEVEQATKIRAKYLRAIENEEWSLLPGSTFVKSFIREYADYLGIDARSLVEEYKLRYERPSESELRPLGPVGRDRGGRGGRAPLGGGRRGVPPWAVLGVVLLALVAALWAVGTLGGDDDDGGGATQATTELAGEQPQGRRGSAPAAGRRRRRRPRRTAPPAPAQAGVRIVPTGTVYVCLEDGAGRVLIPGTIYEAGQQVPVQRARTLRMTLGNGNVQLRANGRPVEVAPSAEAIGFEISPTAVRPLPAEAQPTCT